ncbi:MAG: hypothetical protein GQE15_15555 [Archangiaceae bacterium]|nr:hypothetical protein [Archangiaceae bacterium]
MQRPNRERLVKMRIVAADPSVCDAAGVPLTAIVEVPAETLAPGPRGYRVHVVDYDASSQTLYAPVSLDDGPPWLRRPTAPLDASVITQDPRFHARNVYAIVMKTLARFEAALGRRVSWGFNGYGSRSHQLKVAPHAFSDANAFYSRRDEALLFGYFPAADGHVVHTCLSHDIVVHETSHALLDGLRERYLAPSHPDQAAFHEAFSDLIALLSVFALPELVMHLIDVDAETADAPTKRARRARRVPEGMLDATDARYESLRASMVNAVGRELGREMSAIGRSALRHSLLDVPKSTRALEGRDTPHERGEVLVAAVMEAFMQVWSERLEAYFADKRATSMSRKRAAEEAARCADYLLTMVIRAIDYSPPVHMKFGTLLSAMVTADAQLHPRDPFGFQRALVASFQAYGIRHASKGTAAWNEFDAAAISVSRVRFESMQHDVDEMFRFVFENRTALRLSDHAFMRVQSVRPVVRVAPEDGFHLRETVAEVIQQVELKAAGLARYGIKAPRGMPPDTKVTLHGGVTLIFDEFGKLRFAIGDSVLSPDNPKVQARQSERLASLWERGHFKAGSEASRRFATVHRLRSVARPSFAKETW